MGLGNAKNNYLDRLFGRTNENVLFPEPQQPTTTTMPTGAAGGMVGAFNFLGQPTANPQPNTRQPQPTTQAQPAQETPSSRYKLYQMMQAQPTRDTGQEEIIKRRAKINAIGAGFSGLAGLAGMAVGGDAPFIQDDVTPFNMQQLQTMDTDYRARLQDWVNKGFTVDQANTDLQNQETNQQITAENRMAQIQEQGKNQQQLAEQRAQYALQQLQAKSQAEQIKEMLALGIDPNNENAYGEYLNANKKKFQTELGYTQAKTNWNNRSPSAGRTTAAGGGAQDGSQYGLSTLKAGRDAKLSQLKQEKAEALAKTKPMSPERQEIEKYYNTQIEETRKFKPGANPLIDAEIAELGYQIEEQEFGGYEDEQDEFSMLGGPEEEDEFQWQPLAGQPAAQGRQPAQQGQPSQSKAANLSEPEKMKAMNANAQNVIRNAQAIASVDLNNPDPKTAQLIKKYAQELIEMGVIEAETPEEAMEIAIEGIIRLAQQNAKQ